MIIPYEQLSADTLDSLIESFITREGTDYGDVEFTLAVKVAQVRRQIQTGEVIIVFDAKTESVNLLPRHTPLDDAHSQAADS